MTAKTYAALVKALREHFDDDEIDWLQHDLRPHMADQTPLGVMWSAVNSAEQLPAPKTIP